MKRSRITPVELAFALALVIVPALASSPAGAVLIPPEPLSAGDEGESRLNEVTAGGTSIFVDWQVRDAGSIGLGNTGEFAYLYQVENAATAMAGNVGVFAVSFLSGVPISAAGSLDMAPQADLDDMAMGGFDHNIMGEAFEATFVDLAVSTVISPGLVQWTLGAGLQPGFESETLYFVTPEAPTYQDAVGQGSVQWNTGIAGSDRVVGPVPEPGAVTLFGVGFVITGLALRRRRP